MERILVFVDGMPDCADRPTTRLARDLRAAGHDVTIVNHSSDCVRRTELPNVVVGWPDLLLQDRLGFGVTERAVRGTRRSVEWRNHPLRGFDRVISFKALPTELLKHVGTPTVRFDVVR